MNVFYRNSRVKQYKDGTALRIETVVNDPRDLRVRLSPPAVRAAGDRALAELPLVIEFRITIDGVEADLASYARSQYRAVRADGSWRLAGITSIYERDTLAPAVPGTMLDIDPKELAAYRPPAGTSPGTRAGSASSSDPTCSETTSRNPSHASTGPRRPGSPRPSGGN